MNYDRIYDNLMTKAIFRQLWFPLKCYTEYHHILPKSLFPQFSDLKQNPGNCAILTPEEHYLAHLLLVKMNRYKNHSNYNGLVYGAKMMTAKSPDHCNGRAKNKLYGWVKRLVSEIRKGKSYEEIFGVEKAADIISKMSAAKMGDNHPNFGLHLSEITKGKIRDSHIGVPLSEDTCKKISDTLLGNIPWNSGLTMNDPRVKENIRIMNEKKQIKIDSRELKP